MLCRSALSLRSTLAPAAWLLAAALALGACGDDQQQARREQRGRYTVVYLSGTPYEMGRQHTRLLREELKQGLREIESNLTLKAMFIMSRQLGYVELARKQSYPDLLQECRGMVDEAGDLGWTMEHCLVLNFGDVVAEFLTNGSPKNDDIKPSACSQVVATGKATADGRLYHARILDWMQINYIVNNPVIFVRRPTGALGHVVIGFPGNLSPYQGMNEAGLSVASNEIEPRDDTVYDRTGRSHVQMVGEILTRSRSLAEARDLVQKANHMSLELITVADAKADTGLVLELAPAAVDARPVTDGLVYATNHFLGPRTSKLDEDPAGQSTTLRMERLQQLLPASVAGSLYGKLSPTQLVQVMRDRYNPRTKQQSPATTFDDNSSLATNGALYQLVFDPARLHFWVAAGVLPVPNQAFTGFSLGRLLGLPGHEAEAPGAIP